MPRLSLTSQRKAIHLEAIVSKLGLLPRFPALQIRPLLCGDNGQKIGAHVRVRSDPATTALVFALSG